MKLTEPNECQKQHHCSNYDQIQSPAGHTNTTKSNGIIKRSTIVVSSNYKLRIMRRMEFQHKGQLSYTLSSTRLIFLELSNVRLASSVAEELTFVLRLSISLWTSAGRNTWSTVIFLASARLSEKFLRLSTVKFA